MQKSHKENVEWLNGIKNEIKIDGQERMAITEEGVRNKVRREIRIGKHLA